MPDLPTRLDLFQTFADAVLTRAQSRSSGRQISAQEIYTPGSDINLIGAGASVMGEEVVRQLGRSTADLTLDGAQGAALDRWAADRYGSSVVRKTASTARVVLTFARSSIAAGAQTYPAGSRVQTPGGVAFVLLTAAAFGSTDLGPVTTQARAVSAGTAGNVDAGAITRFITAPPDSTMTVTNASFASGGDVTESDALFRARIRLFASAKRGGTVPAIIFGAKTVPGVREATAIEEGAETGILTGRIFLYIADINGQANAMLIDDVIAALLEWRAGGIKVFVIGAVPVFQPISYLLRFLTGIDQAQAFQQLRQSTVARVNQLAPQAPLLRSLLFEIARSIPGILVFDDTVTNPIGDVIPPDGSGQVIRTRPDLVTAS
jgi:uncharacterized phage protein gp47/JayE